MAADLPGCCRLDIPLSRSAAMSRAPAAHASFMQARVTRNCLSPSASALRKGQCARSPKNWSHGQSNFASHRAMLRMENFPMTRALTSEGRGQTHYGKGLWCCQGGSTIQPQATSFEHPESNLQLRAPSIRKAKKRPWPPWRLIATHANSKFGATHSKYKTSLFLTAPRNTLRESRYYLWPSGEPYPVRCSRFTSVSRACR